jgi:CheY-like chemotaxis protein
MATLLLAEDNDLNRDMLTRRLSRRGYSLLEATNGEEAVEVAGEEIPDVILLDLSMPVMDGWEAAGHLKDDEATADIPIVALTAHAIKGDREKALEAGCDAYVAKPVDMDELVDTIEDMLELDK